ncbi:MAG: hypothetical protein U0L26_15675 [Cellulosilyticum sp.]|nr:hypothetical protein [Cellulosilyticum sp.]
MDILSGEVNKAYKYYLRDGSCITITQICNEVKINFDDVITRVHGCKPMHNIVVKLLDIVVKFLDEIMKPEIPIIQERSIANGTDS